MAYMSPEERISEAVSRGWRSLVGRFSGETQQVPPAATGMAKVDAPKTATDWSKIMPRQVLTRSSTTQPALPTVPGTGYAASYDTGRAATFNGDQVAIAGPNGMRQNMSVADFRTMMNPNDQAAPSLSDNISVQFDPSVSQGARKAFSTDPYAPDTSRYDAYMASPRGRFFGATPLPETQSVGGGSVGEMVVNGIRQRRAQFQSQQDLAMRGQDIQAEDAGMRNQLLAERNASQIPLERAQGEAAQMTVNSALRAQRLYDAYVNEPDEGKKADLLKQYKILTGMKDEQVKPYFSTEVTGMDGSSRTVVTIPDPTAPGGFRKVVPSASGSEDLRSAYATLTPETRAKVDKYFEKRNDVTPDEVIAYIKTINK